MTTIRRGDRVRAAWWTSRPVALAGMQMKVEARPVDVEGPVRHIRSDSPTGDGEVRLFVEHPDGTMCERCGVPEVEVRPEWVTAIVR